MPKLYILHQLIIFLRGGSLLKEVWNLFGQTDKIEQILTNFFKILLVEFICYELKFMINKKELKFTLAISQQ